MNNESEIDEATRLVLEVVEKVLNPNDEISVNFSYPAWSIADWTWNPRSVISCKGEICLNGCTEFWSKYTKHTDLDAQQVKRLNEQYAKCVSYLPQIRKKNYCTFCKRNGESMTFCSTHTLYKNGRISCPVLQKCVCKICGQKGHTLSHCPSNSTRMSILKLIQRCNSMQSI